MFSRNTITACFVISISMTCFASAQDKVTFDDHVKPILRQRCASCHNPNKKSAGLDLTNYTNLMQGGAGGESVVPGDPDDSYLFTVVTHAEEPYMPPNGNKIPENEISMIQKWISGGALETKTSVAKIAKPKFEMAAGTNPNARPEIIPTPMRIPLEPVFVAKRPGNATAIATSPWAPVAAIGMARQVLLYDTTNRQLLGVLPYPEGQVYKLKFSRNGSILVAGGGKDGQSGNVIGWDIRTGERLFEIGDEIDAVMAADISTDHSMIALGGPSKMIRVYSTADGSLLYEIKKHTEWVTSIEFSPDGVLLATGDRNGGLHIWEAETGNEYLTLKGHTKQISAVSWRVDGNILASTSEDTTTKLWEMENGKQVKTWGSHGGGSTGVDFTRDGHILTAGRDKTVKLWKQDGAMVQQFGGLKDIAISCAYCDESGRVLGGDWSGQLSLWNAADKAQLGNLPTNPPTLAASVAFVTGYRDKIRKDFEPIQTQFVATTEKLAQVNKQLASTTGALQTAQTELNTSQAAADAATQPANAAKTELQNFQTALNSRNEAMPLLRESLLKAQEAVKRLPNDADIQKTASLLDEKIKSIEGEIQGLMTEVAAAQEKAVVAQSKLDEANKLLAQSKSKVQGLTKQVAETKAQQAPVLKQHEEQKKQHDQLANKLAAADGQLSRWNAEVALVKTLKELEAKLAAAETAFASEAEKVAKANEQLNAAQAAAQAAQAEQSKALRAVETVQQEILKAKSK